MPIPEERAAAPFLFQNVSWGSSVLPFLRFFKFSVTIFAREPPFSAVSYTHLDVYKRQVL